MKVYRDIQSPVWDDRLAMALYQAKSNIKPRKLPDVDITAFVAFLYSLKGKKLNNPLFGVLAEVPSGLSVHK